MTSHPPFAVLQSYFDKANSGSEEAGVPSHLEDCDECNAIIARLAKERSMFKGVVDDYVRDIPEDGIRFLNAWRTRSAMSKGRSWILASAFCVLLLGLVGYILVSNITKWRLARDVTSPPLNQPVVNTTRIDVLRNGTSWWDTGIYVEVGDEIEISATGTVLCNKGRSVVGPDGDEATAGDGFPLPSARRFALIGVVGRVDADPAVAGADTSYFYIGSGTTFEGEKRRSGVLRLGINDDFPWDNGGSFSITISRRGRQPIVESLEMPGFVGCWVNSSLDIREGDLIEVSIGGRINIGGSGETVGPNDYPPPTLTPNAYPLPRAPRYCVVGFIGSSPDAYTPDKGLAFEKDERMRATASGSFFFAVNDSAYWDNSGAFSVTIRVTRSNSK